MPTAEALQDLRRRTEEALDAGAPRRSVVALAKKLKTLAPQGSDEWMLGTRTLAEYALQDKPWTTSLLVRELVRSGREDHALWALDGLAQATLENYEAAVASYRRAVVMSPDSPFYLHNLGHLLDAALGASAAAEPYLRRACEGTAYQEVAIVESLTMCLLRQGNVVDAAEVVRKAKKKVAGNALLASLERLVRAETRRLTSV